MQIIQGQVRDARTTRQILDRWLEELQPGAVGWLGGTYGITDDGMLVACVRFASAEDARRNSERPEQSVWWKDMEACFSGPITFHDCEDVTLLLGGGSDQAGFVQVMQGRLTDRTKMHELIERSGPLLQAYRPDVLGATIAISDDGTITETVAFRSESEARAAEATPMPAEVSDLVEEEMSLFDDLHYLDLHQPWFATARR
ncbi:MAG: hypothetical protein WCD35_09195 [Mycobacteriales bacterium]